MVVTAVGINSSKGIMYSLLGVTYDQVWTCLAQHGKLRVVGKPDCMASFTICEALLVQYPVVN